MTLTSCRQSKYRSGALFERRLRNGLTARRSNTEKIYLPESPGQRPQVPIQLLADRLHHNLVLPLARHVVPVHGVAFQPIVVKRIIREIAALNALVLEEDDIVPTAVPPKIPPYAFSKQRYTLAEEQPASCSRPREMNGSAIHVKYEAALRPAQERRWSE